VCHKQQQAALAWVTCVCAGHVHPVIALLLHCCSKQSCTLHRPTCCGTACCCGYALQASHGAGLAILAADVADLRDNLIAHNTALQGGGGLWCSNKAENRSSTAYFLTNNTWLNNTALIRGGGVITNPCNMTVHGDKFLGNRAVQEGGGLMLWGGQAVTLQNIQVSC
jgi:hypothetical protein